MAKITRARRQLAFQAHHAHRQSRVADRIRRGEELSLRAIETARRGGIRPHPAHEVPAPEAPEVPVPAHEVPVPDEAEPWSMEIEAQPQVEGPDAPPAPPGGMRQLGSGRSATADQAMQRQDEQGSDSTSLCQMTVHAFRTDGVRLDSQAPPGARPETVDQQAERHVHRGLMTVARDRAAAWIIEHYLYSDDFARRDRMIYCVPYAIQISQATPILNRMHDTFPEVMRAARELCAQIWTRGLPRCQQYARSITALGQSSVDK
eukprot:8455500-Pyramimonas_sp.AAC.1